jgi:hypothetical protein
MRPSAGRSSAGSGRLHTHYLAAESSPAPLHGAEKAGFSREGVLRGTRWRGGAWRDELLYSILRTYPRC